jgi:hypothetical protein
MPPRRPKTSDSAEKPVGAVAALRRQLAKRKKAELIDLLLEMADQDRKVLRQLTARFEITMAAEGWAAATRQAIADATAFDERDINRNFAYDYEAYDAVKRNLSRLIQARQLPLAMELSQELMQAGSHQVEMSDEGLMTEDIEDCLHVVIQALKACDLPAQQVLTWCQAMQNSDRVGFIAEKELQLLRQHLQASDTP